MRHRLGSRGQLLSGWHNNRIGHDLPRGQLVRRRGSECGYVAVLRPLWLPRLCADEEHLTCMLFADVMATCSRVYLQRWLR